MSNFFPLQPPRSFFSQSGTQVLGMRLVWEFWLGFFLCFGVAVFTDDRWYSKNSQVAELTGLENKCSVAETKWFLVQTAPCYSAGETGARYPLTPRALFFCTILCCLSLLRRNYMLGKCLFYCTRRLILPRRATASCECEWGFELLLQDVPARWPSAYPISLGAL